VDGVGAGVIGNRGAAALIRMNQLQGSISFLFGVQGVPPVPWITRDASGLGRTPDGKLGFPYPKSRQLGLVDEEWTPHHFVKGQRVPSKWLRSELKQ